VEYCILLASIAGWPQCFWGCLCQIHSDGTGIQSSLGIDEGVLQPGIQRQGWHRTSTDQHGLRCTRHYCRECIQLHAHDLLLRHHAHGSLAHFPGCGGTVLASGRDVRFQAEFRHRG
jgi:hypothetical protein